MSTAPAPLHRRRIVLWLATCTAAFSAAAVQAGSVRGNGVRRSESRSAAGFTGVAFSLPGELELRLGPVESVVIEADQNILPLIESRVVRGVLELRPLRDQSFDPTHLKVVVTARSIEELALAGSGRAVAQGLKGSQLKFSVTGSGGFDLSLLEVGQLAVAIQGSGSGKLSGSARELELSVQGSGSVAAADLQADEVHVSLAGSGSATVAARSDLAVSIAGSGSVRYRGDPKVALSVAGSGSVRRL